MVDIRNVGTPQVANRAFVALAIEAGIETVIRSLVTLADDKINLLINLKRTLAGSNEPLAEALNMQTLDAILDYMALDGDAAVVPADRLPTLVDQAGPASVSAARDGGAATQVNVTYTQPPQDWTAEIYLDGVFVKHSTAEASGGFVNDAIQGVDIGTHTVRVLYRSPDGEISRFGAVQAIAATGGGGGGGR